MDTDFLTRKTFHWKNWRMNIYACQDKHYTTTVDVDEGVTPFMIGCPHEGCGHAAYSSFYPKERPLNHRTPEPSHEWYKPADEDLAKLSDAERDHVERGGLLMRERTDAEPLPAFEEE